MGRSKTVRYPGTITKIQVYKNRLVVCRSNGKHGSHTYKSDENDYKYFKNIIENFEMYKSTSGNKISLHPLWKGCIIEIN